MSHPTIEIYRSNRSEVLVAALNERLNAPLGDPLSPELLVVQGRGMAVWLSQQLAKRRGVWGNAEFVYPKNFVQKILASVLPDVDADSDPFTQQRLFWALLSEIPKHLSDPRFAPISNYLEENVSTAETGAGARLAPGGSLRASQLAKRIAVTFDEYLVYRPELLLRWDKNSDRAGVHQKQQLDLFSSGSSSASSGEHEGWQAELWRALSERLSGQQPHGPALQGRLLRALSRRTNSRNKPAATLPERISVFGLSNLPPQYLRVLAALAGHTDVRLYLLSPSPEYLGDAVYHQQVELPGDGQNPLLLSCGALAAELQQLLSVELEGRGVVATHIDLYQPSKPGPGKTRLQQLQDDLLAHAQPSPHAFCPDDESITFHACHSAIREVEVLHDQLLKLLDTPRHDGGESFRPEDILVMMPNVDDYAPLVEAVFERSRDDQRFVPYRIADRSVQAESPILDAFLRIVDFAMARGSASEVLDILALEPVRQRFGIAASEVSTIAHWVVDSNVRWGFDRASRRDHGLPPDERNTWLFGLRRLLLGYAVSAEDDTCFGVLPFTEIEGKTGVLLGRFAEFVETLFALQRRLQQSASATTWHGLLTQLLGDLLVQKQDNSFQHQEILEALGEIRRSAEAAGFDEELELAVIRGLIADHFDRKRAARGFLSGGITFCAMVPMRSIPFPVVCLLGMNDGAFPRNTHRADFNLLDHGGYPRQLGDPNRRVDDRYLFLEVLLSARERLLISFIGQSVRDNAAVPPSIVVTELLDYLGHGLSPGPSQQPSQQPSPSEEPSDGSDSGNAPDDSADLVTRHPLQPFSPRYFDGREPKLFSYEQAFLLGAKLLGPERRPATPLFAAPLPSLEIDGVLALSDLVDFFASPAGYLLRRRLGVDLEDHELDVADREPLQLDGLQSYQVGSPALERTLQGIDPERSLELAYAGGLLPTGAPGRFEYDRVQRSAEPIAEAVRAITAGQKLPNLAVDIGLTCEQLGGKLQLQGSLGGLWRAGQVSHQFSRVRGKHLLAVWIRHLALCSNQPTGTALHSWVVGRRAEGDGKRIYRFQTVAEPDRILTELLGLFADGLTEPLLLFPDASFAFCKHLRTPRGDQRQALYHAGVAWRKELRYSRVLQRLFGQDGDLDLNGPGGLLEAPTRPFSEVSQQVYAPLLDHIEEVG